jgi:O-succinylbenzoate synthase
MSSCANNQRINSRKQASKEPCGTLANTQQRALCELLGIERRPVPSGVAIGIFETIDELIERVQRYVTEGYQRVKIKIQPGWDVEPVAAVRAEFPRLPLMVDANAAYTLDDLHVFRELDRFQLTMIEQPLAANAIEDAGELQAQLTTPLCADESAESLTALDQLIKDRAARIINIKVQRVGGLSEALFMLKAACAAGLQCWVGTMPELGIASAQALHLAMHSAFSYPTDIEASSRWYVDDVHRTRDHDRSERIHLCGRGPGNRLQSRQGKKSSATRRQWKDSAHETFFVAIHLHSDIRNHGERAGC